jgi:hypothetical protein
MNAQQQMIEYAKSKMSANSTLTPEQWCGKMITEGIVISRDAGDMVVAKASRQGQAIVITETTKAEKLHGIEETTVEVMRINL